MMMKSDTAYQSVIASANALIVQKLDIIADLRAELDAVTAERDLFKDRWELACDHRNEIRAELATVTADYDEGRNIIDMLAADSVKLRASLAAVTAERDQSAQFLEGFKQETARLLVEMNAGILAERSRAWLAGVQSSRDAIMGGRFLHDQAPTAKFAREVDAMLAEMKPPAEFAAPSEAAPVEPTDRRYW